jgi:hypothetical protein
VLSRPDVRAKMSESNKRWRSENPEKVALRDAKSKATMGTAEARKRNSEAVKAAIANDPGILTRQLASRRRWEAENPDTLEQHKQKRREAMRADKNRLHLSKVHKKKWQDSGYRMAQIARLRAGASTPEAKRKQKESQKSRWNDSLRTEAANRSKEWQARLPEVRRAADKKRLETLAIRKEIRLRTVAFVKSFGVPVAMPSGLASVEQWKRFELSLNITENTHG